MGKLPDSAFEVRLAATLFLLVMGLADLFGAWQVKNFASFSPAGVARTVSLPEHHEMVMACCATSDSRETPVDLSTLDVPAHKIGRELLVQDTHVHIPAYAMTAALLSLIVFGLALPRGARVALILLAFGAPVADFAGLWGAQLFPSRGSLFGGVAIAGGFAMGIAYLVVLILTLAQSWTRAARKEVSS
jgi:hypothetical protein